MKISEMTWEQVEAYLETDDRCVIPFGCTEQHAFISLATDSILAEKVASDAASPLGVPIFPVLAYGIRYKIEIGTETAVGALFISPGQAAVTRNVCVKNSRQFSIQPFVHCIQTQ